MVLSLRFSRSCSRSSFIGALQIERKVIVGNAAQYHGLEPVEFEQPIPFGIGDGSEERLAGIIAQHREEPAQRRTPLADVLLEGVEVAAQAWLDLEDLDLFRCGWAVAGESLATRRPVLRIGHAGIDGPVGPGVACDPARPVIQDDPLEVSRTSSDRPM